MLKTAAGNVSDRNLRKSHQNMAGVFIAWCSVQALSGDTEGMESLSGKRTETHQTQPLRLRLESRKGGSVKVFGRKLLDDTGEARGF